VTAELASPKPWGSQINPPKTVRGNNYKNIRVYFLSKSELTMLDGKEGLETSVDFQEV
jgi:hypothetical protein